MRTDLKKSEGNDPSLLMIVTIHQPEHLPWLGFFDKVMQADVYVALDNVQFRKNYFQNRNRIRTADGWKWITIPIRNTPAATRINEVMVDCDSRLRNRYLNLIKTECGHAPHFRVFFPILQEIVNRRYDRLLDLNLAMLGFLFQSLEIKTRVVIASSLGLESIRGGTAVNLSICRALGADIYLSGISGSEYLDEEAFKHAGIEVAYQEFYHPIYAQLHSPFVPCMSAIDLLFNHGPRSADVLRGRGVERITQVFS